LLCLFAAMCFVINRLQRPDRFNKIAEVVGSSGYGLPGALLAVGLFVPVTYAIVWLSEQLQIQIAGAGLGLLMAAYLARFCTVAHAPVSSGAQRIRPSWMESAQLLGFNGWRWLSRFYLPLMQRSVLLAILLVFVDVMKEMPITLMMRPFGWDTLATRVFELSNEGLWEQAALPSLFIVLVGLIPIVFLNRGAASET
jgi:iron(III) transport system permease protein